MKERELILNQMRAAKASAHKAERTLLKQFIYGCDGLPSADEIEQLEAAMFPISDKLKQAIDKAAEELASPAFLSNFIDAARQRASLAL